jgi:hypothetical protein
VRCTQAAVREAARAQPTGHQPVASNQSPFEPRQQPGTVPWVTLPTCMEGSTSSVPGEGRGYMRRGVYLATPGACLRAGRLKHRAVIGKAGCEALLKLHTMTCRMAGPAGSESWQQSWPREVRRTPGMRPLQ